MADVTADFNFADRLDQMALIAKLTTPWPESCRQEMRQAAKELRSLRAALVEARLENERLREDWEEVVELRGEVVTCRKAYGTVRAALSAAVRANESAAAEVATLRGEVAAFRKAIIDGTGPSCEDVCQRSCIGVCGTGSSVGDESENG